ncbi:MAG: arginine deiminase [Saprospiraceae bacterium]|jgi:arginine deiminase|nr:arginine deiminase [Candidatus Vicinibacter proximus]MBL7824306.1 arginine deiminase [Saprospiraceae bacterium]MCC6843569.1 arginine deiminase [Saprospiraceae bacterium]HRG31709.1 arginine deiminase family protein [Saprospiraceae bacterium]
MGLSKEIYVDSEIMPLKKVIVHAPDEGIDRISPKRAGELLFDDIVYLPAMQREHKIFTNVLGMFIGDENVLETETLIREALDASVPLKEELLQKLAEWEELPGSVIKSLNDMDHGLLAEVLISGYNYPEDHILFDPIPNFIFTRDIALTIKDHVVITKASKSVRHRENLLTRFFIYAHPQFSNLLTDDRLINLNLINDFPPSRKGEPISIEGGDLMLLNEDYLLIGSSERTTDHALNTLKKILFDRKLIKNIVEVDVPKERSFMHIDTLFTQIDHLDFVGYKPIVKDGLGSYVTVHRSSGEMVEYPSVLDFLHAEISPEINFIWSGDGESPYQEREQWTDGCNLLTIRPGVALTYDRNPNTEKAFRNNGYSVIHANEFLRQVEGGSIEPSELKKTIITLPSSELSRARGGTHCMSCPVIRQKISEYV